MTQIPIALQLYTVREAAGADLTGTFAEVAKIGYTNVELAGLYGKTATELKKILEDFGLNAVSAHVGIDAFEGDNLGQTIKDYQELGVASVIVPHIGEDIRHAPAGYKGLAERLNAAGELVGKYGLAFGYHNHNFEFTETESGKSGIETLMDNTDPALVTFELDTYWALFAGFDPVEFINKHATRLSLLHIKDLDPVDRSFAPVGTGSLPLDAIIAAGISAQSRYFIVEHDTTKGPELDAIRTSLNNLKAKGYA